MLIRGFIFTEDRGLGIHERESADLAAVADPAGRCCRGMLYARSFCMPTMCSPSEGGHKK